MRKVLREVRYSLLLGVAGVSCGAQVSAQVTAQQQFQIDIEPQDLDSALRAIGRQTGREIMYPLPVVSGLAAPALHGRMTADQAVRALIADKGLIAEFRPDVILLRADKASHKTAGVANKPADIIVTGSRIRGSEPASPLILASRGEIEKRGISDLGNYARSLPQNYSGGQNPGIPAGNQRGSENVSSSSALNLRGLGPDATLTLFNGHRVAYDAIGQGVDISAIPLAAVERVEIVADGASALYGSDAVGGVANVILRRDFEGVSASARIGAATDGGDVEQQYNVVSGKRWQTGGFMAAFDYRHSTPITAAQRSYTQSNSPDETLQAGQRQVSAVFAGHQRLGENLTFEVDGQFSDRKSHSCLNFTATAGCLVSGGDINVGTRSWTIAPSLVLEIASAWELHLGGMVGESKVDQNVDIASGGVALYKQIGIYKNLAKSLEISAEGPLFDLPGGAARLAVGGGLRGAKFTIDVSTLSGGGSTPYTLFSLNRTTRYAYGELSLPLVSSENSIPFIERMTLTTAVRYEDVDSVGKVATPKMSFVYAPSRDLALKFSWGKSFKAPTLYQTGQPVIGASQVGSTMFLPPSPTPGTVLYLTGGNPDLKPERATNWTATASLTPRFVEGLRIDASYFHIAYRNRVVSPIPLNSVAFSPLYSAYVTLNPTRAQILSAIANVPIIYNQGGGDVTTANVVALVTNYLQNAVSQSIQGVDLDTTYTFSPNADNKFTIRASASYLESRQQLSAGQSATQLAGIIFYPPHWRGYSSVDWQHGAVSLRGAFTYIGGLLDNRIAPDVHVGAFKSVDLVGQIRLPSNQGVFANTTIGLSLLNLFNEKPSYTRTTSSIGYHYDATNYPSVGRFVSLTLSKDF